MASRVQLAASACLVSVGVVLTGVGAAMAAAEPDNGGPSGGSQRPSHGQGADHSRSRPSHTRPMVPGSPRTSKPSGTGQPDPSDSPTGSTVPSRSTTSKTPPSKPTSTSKLPGGSKGDAARPDPPSAHRPDRGPHRPETPPQASGPSAPPQDVPPQNVPPLGGTAPGPPVVIPVLPAPLPIPAFVPLPPAPEGAVPGGRTRESPPPPPPPPPNSTLRVPPRAPAAPTESPVTVPPPVAGGEGGRYRAGYADYLRVADTTEIAAVAVPGTTGLVALTALGGVLGYRQAKAGRALRVNGTARFLE